MANFTERPQTVDVQPLLKSIPENVSVGPIFKGFLGSHLLILSVNSRPEQAHRSLDGKEGSKTVGRDYFGIRLNKSPGHVNNRSPRPRFNLCASIVILVFLTVCHLIHFRHAGR